MRQTMLQLLALLGVMTCFETIDNKLIPDAVYDLSNQKLLLNLTIGETVQLNCGSQLEILEQMKTKWYKNGIPLKNLPSVVISKYTITLVKMKLADEGTYACEVLDEWFMSNEVKFYRSALICLTTKKPSPKVNFDTDEFDEPDKSMESCANLGFDAQINPIQPYLCFDLEGILKMVPFTVRYVGSSAILHCNAKGHPKPEVKWFKHSKTNNSPQIKLVRIQTNYHYRVDAQNTLRIDDLEMTDAGMYTCRIRNFKGIFNYDTRLDVIERSYMKPLLMKKPENLTGIIGGTIQFNVTVVSTPEYRVSWVKHYEDTYENTTEVKSRVTSESAVDEDSLRLDDLTVEDEGWYTVIVGNSIGRETATFYLQIVEAQEQYVSEDGGKIERTKRMILVITLTIAFLMIVLICYQNQKRTKKPVGPQSCVKVVSVINNTTTSEDSQVIIRPSVNIEMKMVNGIFSEDFYSITLDPNWEVKRDILTLDRKLGEGAFGLVRLGLLQQPNSELTKEVAVKSLKPGIENGDEDMKDLVREMELLKNIGKHENVIELIGACTQDGPLLVLTEYAPFGDLRGYLRDRRPNYVITAYLSGTINPECLFLNDLISFCFQVAKGMNYLAERKFIHRDLAARNVLVLDKGIVKISDFGMSRYLDDGNYYRKQTGGRLPVRWMAPEALANQLYSSQSDMWSFGVLAWEILALGGTPYPKVSSAGLEYLLGFLQRGCRLQRPLGCPNEMYALMNRCWNFTPEKRPTFAQIEIDLERMIPNDEKYYMELVKDEPGPDEIHEFAPTPMTTPENSDTDSFVSEQLDDDACVLSENNEVLII